MPHLAIVSDLALSGLRVLGEVRVPRSAVSPDSWINLCWRCPGQPELFGAIGQVLDGGGVRPSSTAWRALAHSLEV
jgi:hypothetical protein